jgi:hypothetical protein
MDADDTTGARQQKTGNFFLCASQVFQIQTILLIQLLRFSIFPDMLSNPQSIIIL